MIFLGGVATVGLLVNMVKKKDGKNQTVWCGEVLSPMVVSHERKNSDKTEVLETFYRFNIKVEVKTNKGKVLDTSTLPMVVSEKMLETLEKPLEVGDIVFIRGSWRAYTVVDEGTERRRVEQVGFVQYLVHSELRDGKSLNRFDFEGYLVHKLYDPVRDAEGNPVRRADGSFEPNLDEDGNKQWTVRLNKEKKIVNDYTIAINRNNRSFYIPSLSYYNLAKKIADEIGIGDKVEGSGYIRSREFEKNGEKQVVYEAVIVSLGVIEEVEETIVETTVD